VDSPPRTAAPFRLIAVVLGAVVLLLGAAAFARSPAAHAGAAWVWPLDGPHVVSRPFGLGPTRYSAGHRGADLPSTPGAPVRAAGAGRVSYAGLLAGRGVVVVVHGSLRTTYEPVSALVRSGEPVAAGDPIGVLQPGHAGCPAQACLHWGLLRGEVYLDPVALVERGPVRLLPLDGAPAAPAAGQAAGQAAGPAGQAAGEGVAVGAALPAAALPASNAPVAPAPAAPAPAAPGSSGASAQPSRAAAVASTSGALLAVALGLRRRWLTRALRPP
jgi:hypothetical protein